MTVSVLFLSPELFVVVIVGEYCEKNVQCLQVLEGKVTTLSPLTAMDLIVSKIGKHSSRLEALLRSSTTLSVHSAPVLLRHFVLPPIFYFRR